MGFTREGSNFDGDYTTQLYVLMILGMYIQMQRRDG